MAEKVYALKGLPFSRKAYNGFLWPNESGVIVTCNDWNPEPVCGGGLHAFRNGCGCAELACWDDDAVWYVLSANAETVVDIDGKKCKAPAWTVEFVGRQEEAVKVLEQLSPMTAFMPVMGTVRGDQIAYRAHAGDHGQAFVNHYGQSVSGTYGKSSGGNHSQVIAGPCGYAKSGGFSQALSGEAGTSSSGHQGLAASGDCGKSTSGKSGQSISGWRGESTSGAYGQAISGVDGKSSSGDYGLAATYNGKVRAGIGGLLVIQYSNSQNQLDWLTAVVDGVNIKADTWYEELNGKFIEVVE